MGSRTLKKGARLRIDAVELIFRLVPALDSPKLHERAAGVARAPKLGTHGGWSCSGRRDSTRSQISCISVARKSM